VLRGAIGMAETWDEMRTMHRRLWTFDASARIAADLAWRDRDRRRSAANREHEDAIIASWNAEVEPDYSAPLESVAA
jgi:hypothetical protein